MKGKKKYKDDRFSRCDGCGKRVYKESERHYKEKYFCSISLGFPTIPVEVYCDDCDKDGLTKIILELQKKHLEIESKILNNEENK